MKYLTVDQLRQMFLEYFQGKGHKKLPSASLVPHGDPTLLLTGAGMVPFKPYFLGQETPEHTRVTTCQRCLRTPDIDNVGKTDRHGTFFEMLGNFSFGDYFKKEAIPYAWEFVTEHIGFPKDKLWVSVYLDDDEAYNIWNQEVGIPKERIVRLGKEDNFWEIGVGPCGPCSEIYIDRGPEHGCDDPNCKPGCDCDRFIEVWNLVFIQFYQDENGNLSSLKKPGIDTGMGMERLAVIVQNANSIFEIDNLRPIVDAVAELAGTKYGENPDNDVSLRVITDHTRGITFLVNDGVLPSNEGRGYILRRLLRRAARYGKLLGIHGKFLNKVVDVVIEQMHKAYPEIVEQKEYIQKVIGLEEQRFHETLDQGIHLLQDIMEKARTNNSSVIDGQDAFKLYDTFGFPIELTREIADEEGFTVDEQGFSKAMQAQRERARAARGETGYLGEQVELYKELKEQVNSTFVGYSTTEEETNVVALICNDQLVEKVGPNQQAIIILNSTPFYAESGGQVADTGTVTGKLGQFSVKDVRKPVEGIVAHHGVVTSGELTVGDKVLASVYNKERLDTARHHTATHLLHKAIKEVLGDHANQAGSYVAPERLRFDFTHFQATTPEQLKEIEVKVNESIMRNYPVETVETSMDEAKNMGAMALFGEKYGTRVRVVKVANYSLELCGGTHVPATGSIGLFRIVSEASVAAGVRRIEAVAGKYALRYTDQREQILNESASKLQTKPEELSLQIERLLSTQRNLEKELQKFKQKTSQNLSEELITQAETIGGVSVVVAEVPANNPEELRELGDKLREKLVPSVIFLGASIEDKVLLLGMATKQMANKQVHVGNVIKSVAKICGGGGGGRPDMAQAGGRLPEKLPEALKEARQIIASQLEGNV